jgi:integrase
MRAGARLTRALVAAAAPGPRDRFLWDAEVTGFGLKVTPAGGRSFVLQYRAHGRSRRLVIGRLGAPWTPETARDRARVLLAGLACGRDPAEAAAAASRRTIGLADLAGLYLETHPAGASWRASVRRSFANHVLPLLGERAAAQVTAADVDRVMAAVGRGETARPGAPGGRSAADQAVRALSAVLAFGVRRGLVPHNPALGVKRYPRPRIERFLDADDYRRLGRVLAAASALRSLSPQAVAAIRLMALTGARKSDVLALTWAQVDLAGARLRVDGRRRPREIALGAAALALLGELSAGRGGIAPEARVVPGRGGGPFTGLDAAWAKVLAAARLEGVRLQDLRQSYAALASTDGESLVTIARLLGQGAASAERYAHLAGGAPQAAAERLSGRLAALLGCAVEPRAPAPAGGDARARGVPPPALAARRWLTAPEAAERAGLTLATLAAYRQAGLGPPYRKLPGRVIYPEDPLVAWIVAREAQPRRGRPPNALRTQGPDGEGPRPARAAPSGR